MRHATLAFASRVFWMALLTTPALIAQTYTLASNRASDSDAVPDGSGYRRNPPPPMPSVSVRPFSQFAIGAGISPLGASLQITTNITRHLNLRAIGNAFPYSTNFSTSGFNSSAKLNLISSGIAADIYPFHKGFRISPGVLFLNNNKLTASSVVTGGSTFTLNGETFYSANANSLTGAAPLNANATLGLNTNKPAFMITAGWGNTIPRDGGHWSVPFEVGTAFIGSPSLTAKLNGWACYDQAQTQCTNVASTTDPLALQIQGDLVTQVSKWQHDLNPLRTFPILSIGVAYNFGRNGFTR